jgi:hypothetical protein
MKNNQRKTMLNNILDKLSGVYSKESAQYKSVAVGLSHMNGNQLSNLWAMMLTAI